MGFAADGRPYSADDPDLVTFIHAAETWSFLESARRFGPRDLTPEQCDRYYVEMAPVAVALGAEWVPRSAADVDGYFQRLRPELHAGPQAFEARDWLRHGVAQRPNEHTVYVLLLSAAVDLAPVGSLGVGPFRSRPARPPARHRGADPAHPGGLGRPALDGRAPLRAR